MADVRGQRAAVPYCELSVNAETPIVSGGDDVTVTVSLVAGRAGFATLSVSGLRALPTADSAHTIWVTRQLTIGDRITLVTRSAGTPAPAVHTETTGPRDIEQVARALEQLTTNGSSSLLQPRLQDIAVPPSRPLQFRISLSSGRVVEAPLEDHEQLQLIGIFEQGWKIGTIEVDSLTVTEQGYTRSTRWLTYETALDEALSVEIAP